MRKPQNFRFANYVLLSVTKDSSIPNWVKIFLQTNFWACAAVMEESGSASIHFTCLAARGKGPKRLIPHLENGHGDIIAESSSAGAM